MLLAAKPVQRRQVFEEAAGIARYQTRAAEADRKLHHTRQNMAQVNTIIAEVKRSRDVLANQVERTSQYRNLQERIFGAERDLELIRLRANLRERLRTTTDDIVASLDTGLQAAGYSPEARAAAEEIARPDPGELHATLSAAPTPAHRSACAPTADTTS